MSLVDHVLNNVKCLHPPEIGKHIEETYMASISKGRFLEILLTRR